MSDTNVYPAETEMAKGMYKICILPFARTRAQWDFHYCFAIHFSGIVFGSDRPTKARKYCINKHGANSENTLCIAMDIAMDFYKDSPSLCKRATGVGGA